MEFKARAVNMRVSQRKLGLLADFVRGKGVQQAIDSLRFNEKRWARKVLSVVQSALNNASQNRGVNVDRLYVKKVFVEKGPTLKRFMTRARGSASQILKRISHLTVVLEERS